MNAKNVKTPKKVTGIEPEEEAVTSTEPEPAAPAGDVSGSTVPTRGPAAPNNNENPPDGQPNPPTIDESARVAADNRDVVMDTPNRLSSHDEQNEDRIVVDRVDDPPASSAAAPQPPEEAQAPEAAPEDNSGHTDTTNPPEALAPDEAVIDIPDESNIGHVQLGGGADIVNDDVTPIGITQPIVAPVEDVADFGRVAMPKDELNRLDETDSARAAAIRRQANWVEDSKKIFKGATEAELERQENLNQIGVLDARERKRVEEENKAKGIATERENAAATIKALETEYEGMKTRAFWIRDELVRLGKIAAGGDEPRSVEPEPPAPEPEPEPPAEELEQEAA